MPQYCCVPGCKNRIGGHRFPRDPQLLNKWRIAIRRMSSTKKGALWMPKDHDVVCRDHFKPEDITPDSILLNRIFPGTIPSVFQFHESDKKVKSRSKKLYKNDGVSKLEDSTKTFISAENNLVPKLQQVTSENQEIVNDSETINFDVTPVVPVENNLVPNIQQKTEVTFDNKKIVDNPQRVTLAVVTIIVPTKKNL